MNKKLLITLSMLLLTAVLLGSVTSFALARNTVAAQISVSDVTAGAGEEVKVNVSISENPGIIGMTLSLIYDESIMKLTKVEKGSALNEMTFTVPQELKSGCRFPWDAESVKPEEVTNGDILVLTFKIADNAPEGNYDIKFSYDPGAIIDNNLNAVNAQIKNGVVTVMDNILLKGDFDKDGIITVADALSALRIAAKIKAPVAEDFKIGDMDADGNITVSDALAILRIAAKMA